MIPLTAGKTPKIVENFDELLDIISSYPNTMASGLLYITDKEFCEEQGLYDDMGKVYTKDMIDEIRCRNGNLEISICEASEEAEVL